MLESGPVSLLARVRSVVLIIVVFALGSTGCKNDMAYQAALRPGETVFEPAPGAVPTTGLEPEAVARDVSDALVNPIAPSVESIDRGALRYAIHCATCHGAQGGGDGVLEEELGPLEPLSERLPNVSDGYLYSIIRHGSISMPSYGSDLTITERWDIVNFIRTLVPND